MVSHRDHEAQQGALRLARAVVLEGGPHPHEAFTETDWRERVARAQADTEGDYANSAWPLGYQQTRRQTTIAKDAPAVVWAWRGNLHAL